MDELPAMPEPVMTPAIPNPPNNDVDSAEYAAWYNTWIAGPQFESRF